MNTQNFTILIVDDEKDIRKTLSLYLEMDGYKTITASGAREAIQLIQGEVVDFIISDVQMPDGDGIELLTHIRKTNPVIPVIVLVTGQTQLTKEEAIKLGANDLLMKPINLEILEEYILNTSLNKGAV